MTLNSILADCYRRLGFGTSPDSEVTTRLTAFINEVHKEILGDPICSKLRRRSMTFSTIASSPFCVTPQVVERIYGITDQTNSRPLMEVSQQWIRNMDPGRSTTTSTPEAFAVVNYSSPVARHPSDASQLLVDSTSASDTNTAYLEEVQDGGYLRQSSVTMTGTTAVNLGSSDVTNVLDFYLSAAAVGVVTLVEDASGGTVLATINIGQTRAKYTMLEIYPMPSSAVTLYLDADVVVTDLVNANDELLIPSSYDYVLLAGVRKKEYEKREHLSQAKTAEMDFVRGMGRLHHHMHRMSGFPVPPDVYGNRGGVRRSQLGPYYPPGS